MLRAFIIAVPLAVGITGTASAALSGNGFTATEKEWSIAGVPKNLVHGKKYTITAKNAGQFPHDLLVDGKGLEDVGIHNKHPIAPGKTGSFTLTFPKAGKYHIYCALPGHAAKGMTLTVVVR